MKAWEIYSYQHREWPEPHPAVIVSHPDRVAMKPEVTILLCSSKPAARSAKPHEVILDSSDGLDWPTVCKCDLLYTLPKSALIAPRGTVTAERRRQIAATINRAMRTLRATGGFIDGAFPAQSNLAAGNRGRSAHALWKLR